MRTTMTQGQICLNDEYGLTYNIAKIEYTLREDDSFRYVFTPNYSVISLLSPRLFQGIPGLDLDSRKPQYIRENRTPVFISERTPGENREDLWTLLDECHMKYLDRLEWLIRTKNRYSGDCLYVRRYDPQAFLPVTINDLTALGSRSVNIIKKLLEILCAGRTLSAPGIIIDDTNREQYYHLLMSLFRQEKSYLAKRQHQGVQKAVAEGKYNGRKPIQIDDARFEEVVRDYNASKLTGKCAAQKLGISYSTFYRRLKTFQDDAL